MGGEVPIVPTQNSNLGTLVGSGHSSHSSLRVCTRGNPSRCLGSKHQGLSHHSSFGSKALSTPVLTLQQLIPVPYGVGSAADPSAHSWALTTQRVLRAMVPCRQPRDGSGGFLSFSIHPCHFPAVFLPLTAASPCLCLALTHSPSSLPLILLPQPLPPLPCFLLHARGRDFPHRHCFPHPILVLCPTPHELMAPMAERTMWHVGAIHSEPN